MCKNNQGLAQHKIIKHKKDLPNPLPQANPLPEENGFQNGDDNKYTGIKLLPENNVFKTETQDVKEEQHNWQDQFNFDIPRDVHNTTELYRKHQQMSNNTTISHFHKQAQTTENERPSKKSRSARPSKETDDTRLYYKCSYCNRHYLIQDNLRKHIKNQHPLKFNNYFSSTPFAMEHQLKLLYHTYGNDTLSNQMKFDHLFDLISKLENDKKLHMLLLQAETAAKSDVFHESKKSSWFRFKNCDDTPYQNFPGATKSDKISNKMSTFVSPILENLRYSIVKSKEFTKQKYVEVQFLNADLDALAQTFKNYCSQHPGTEITQLHYIYTRVRLNILRKLGHYICKANKKLFFVKCVDNIPHLFIKGNETTFSKFTYGQALVHYFEEIEFVDFKDCIKDCIFFQIPRTEWKNFFVFDFNNVY